MKTTSALRYLLILSILFIFVAFGAWYLFIRGKQASIEQGDAARGANSPAQSFESAFGNTYENIVSNLSGVVSGAREDDAVQELPRLAQVNKSPTAGAGFIANATTTRLRFVERGTGFIFDVTPGTGELARLTNTLVRRVSKASITKSGRALMRSVGEDEAPVMLTASIGSTTTPEGLRTLMQRRLPDGIRSIATNASDELLYIVDGQTGSIGMRTAWDGTKEKQLFSSGISGWQLRWTESGRIFITQNPSDGVPGYSYEVQKDGTFSPLLRAIPGLTLLPHESSGALLYGASGGGLTLFVQVSETSTSVSLPIRTVADKCVWAPASPEATQGKSLIAYCAVPQSQPPTDFLDRWHRGEVHTADSWWRVDASAASAELLYSPGNTTLDVESPVIDAEGTYIAFTNAIDRSLWLLRISE